MRRAAKVDRNQGEIVEALIAAGAVVQSLAAVGKGVADLLVRAPASRDLYLLEVKDGTKPPSARKLTTDQLEWHARWPVVVVNSKEQALRAIGVE